MKSPDAKDWREARSPDRKPERSPAPAKTSPPAPGIAWGLLYTAQTLPVAALAKGPFCPPKDFVFEPELQPSVPRPDSGHAPKSNFVLLGEVQLFFLLLGGVLCEIAVYARDQNRLLRIVNPEHLSWIGYALLALWGVLVLCIAVASFKPSAGCDYIRNGRPVVARILGLANTPDLDSSGQLPLNYIVALIEYRDPETGKQCAAEVKSQPFLSLERANYTTSFRVGDYVTAIYLPDVRSTSMELFSFLGHTPNVGVVRRINYPRVLRAVLACLLVLAPFALLETCSYFSHFYEPMDFGNWEQFKLFGCGVIASAVILFGGLWGACALRARLAVRRKAFAIAHGLPIEIDRSSGDPIAPVLGLVITTGVLVGGLVGISVAYGLNAWLDTSPARIQRLELERLEEGPRDTSYDGYSIVYWAHILKARRHGSSPGEVQAWRLAGAIAGDAEIHEGYFGWRWIKTMQPVAAAPQAPVNRQRL
jgi:hypothetical protein